METPKNQNNRLKFLMFFSFRSEMENGNEAKLSIYRCQHVLKRKIEILTHCDVTWCGVSEQKQISIKYECDLARAKHLNYFRSMNFNGRQNLVVEMQCQSAVVFICFG